MTLRVNHQKARFIFLLSQQTAEFHSSSSATATYMPAGWFWLPATLPSQYNISPPKAQPAMLQHVPPLGYQTHMPCMWMCLPKAATRLCPKTRQHCRYHQSLPWKRWCRPSEAALGMLLVHSTPYSLRILLRCSANLGSLPAVKPNTADRSASRGKRSVFYPL